MVSFVAETLTAWCVKGSLFVAKVVSFGVVGLVTFLVALTIVKSLLSVPGVVFSRHCIPGQQPLIVAVDDALEPRLHSGDLLFSAVPRSCPDAEVDKDAVVFYPREGPKTGSDAFVQYVYGIVESVESGQDVAVCKSDDVGGACSGESGDSGGVVKATGAGGSSVRIQGHDDPVPMEKIDGVVVNTIPYLGILMPLIMSSLCWQVAFACTMVYMGKYVFKTAVWLWISILFGKHLAIKLTVKLNSMWDDLVEYVLLGTTHFVLSLVSQKAWLGFFVLVIIFFIPMIPRPSPTFIGTLAVFLFYHWFKQRVLNGLAGARRCITGLIPVSFPPDEVLNCPVCEEYLSLPVQCAFCKVRTCLFCMQCCREKYSTVRCPMCRGTLPYPSELDVDERMHHYLERTLSEEVKQQRNENHQAWIRHYKPRMKTPVVG
eukprot:GFYU01008277.1.p1 GENE.GFYU01008277.1~~GFYU01008277.1.p1  ORF type:complete len:430 (+),score=107.77 GFYU01008277.1:202-1491(+)